MNIFVFSTTSSPLIAKGCIPIYAILQKVDEGLYRELDHYDGSDIKVPGEFEVEEVKNEIYYESKISGESLFNIRTNFFNCYTKVIKAINDKKDSTYALVGGYIPKNALYFKSQYSSVCASKIYFKELIMDAPHSVVELRKYYKVFADENMYRAVCVLGHLRLSNKEYNDAAQEINRELNCEVLSLKHD